MPHIPGDMSWARTRRLALRELVAQDVDALVQMHRDARVRALLIDDVPLHDPAYARRFIDGMMQIYRRREGLGIWHVTLLEPQPAFVGCYNLMPVTDRPEEIELGGRLMPLAWGRGLALEGGVLLLDHAFERLGRERVWSMNHPHNRSAQMVVAALGFESLGVKPHGGALASHWCIDAATWWQWQGTPRGERLRRAMRVLA